MIYNCPFLSLLFWIHWSICSNDTELSVLQYHIICPVAFQLNETLFYRTRVAHRNCHRPRGASRDNEQSTQWLCHWRGQSVSLLEYMILHVCILDPFTSSQKLFSVGYAIGGALVQYAGIQTPFLLMIAWNLVILAIILAVPKPNSETTTGPSIKETLKLFKDTKILAGLGELQ